MGALLAPVEAVERERAAPRCLHVDPELDEPRPTALREHVAPGASCSEDRIGPVSGILFDPEHVGGDEPVAHGDTESASQVVVAGPGPPDRLGMGPLAKRADLLGRGEAGEGLERVRDLGAGDAEVPVAARGLDAHQAAVDQASQVRGERGGSHPGLCGQRARGERPAVEKRHQYRGARRFAHQGGNRGDIDVPCHHSVANHFHHANACTLRGRAKHPAKRPAGGAPEAESTIDGAASRPRGRPSLWPLVAICVGYVMVIIDTMVVNVALPALSKSLHTSTSGLQWIVDAYSLVFGALLLSAGALGDRRGAKAVFQVGMAVFAVSSLSCGLAPTTGLLIAARGIQGLGAALAVPASFSLLQAAYPDQATRRRAVGIRGAVAGIAAGAGPVVGGALVSGLGWRSVFS